MFKIPFLLLPKECAGKLFNQSLQGEQYKNNLPGQVSNLRHPAARKVFKYVRTSSWIVETMVLARAAVPSGAEAAAGVSEARLGVGDGRGRHLLDLHRRLGGAAHASQLKQVLPRTTEHPQTLVECPRAQRRQ